MPKLLLVDDDEDICSLLSSFFRKYGYDVAVATDGRALFAEVERSPVDLVILDVMLKDEDGFSVCRRLRTVSAVPVIMLTAMADRTDRVVGLEVGADDYLTKPFDQRELLARVKAVLRRATGAAAPTAPATRPVLRFGAWSLDVARRELRSSAEEPVQLSASEFDLLLAFAEHPRRILTREQLIQLARGPESQSALDRSVDVVVSRLRNKLEEEPRDPSFIRTVRNEGYIFLADVVRG
jgi:two-component system, OmpR family, response regulator